MQRINLKKRLFVSLLTSLFFMAPLAHAEQLKVGFVTDWEYGEQSKVGHKIPSKAKRYLSSAVNYYNKVYKPEIVIGGGDFISSYDVSKSKAKKQIRSINNTFKKVQGHRIYCIGNHDLAKLNKNDFKKALGINYTHSVTDVKNFRIITVDTNTQNSKGKYETVGRVSADELVWLEQQLSSSPFPVVVFMHHSPIHTPDGGGTRANLRDGDQVRAILEKYNNVVAVVSGHHPINHSEVKNGITYVMINNLGAKASAGAFAMLDMDSDGKNATINITQLGKKPALYSISRTIN